ncbi:MAG TPA: retron system putative HNH endonuclease [Bacilli bacterium]|nr:retron system putative HNH endonuclease [Bacilli bacterium]
MRFIQKIEAPVELGEWKRDFYQDHKIRAKYKDLAKRPDVRQALKKSLLAEQFSICCYCLARIESETSHIEHLKPQSKFPGEQLSYQNMFLSCLATRHEEGELSCGHNKDDFYHEKWFVSPLDLECGEYFKYTMSGEILPACEFGSEGWQKATTTIEKLNLNASRLKRLRKVAIDVALQNDFDPTAPLDESELRKRMKYYEMPKSNGELEPFCSAITFMLGKELDATRKRKKSDTKPEVPPVS